MSDINDFNPTLVGEYRDIIAGGGNFGNAGAETFGQKLDAQKQLTPYFKNSFTAMRELATPTDIGKDESSLNMERGYQLAEQAARLRLSQTNVASNYDRAMKALQALSQQSETKIEKPKKSSPLGGIASAGIGIAGAVAAPYTGGASLAIAGATAPMVG